MATDIDAWAQAGLIYELSESVAWLRLNRPQRRNAMDHYPGGEGPNGMGLRDALLEAIRDATEDKTVKVAVITGVARCSQLAQTSRARRWRSTGAQTTYDGRSRRSASLRLVPPARVDLAQ